MEVLASQDQGETSASKHVPVVLVYPSATVHVRGTCSVDYKLGILVLSGILTPLVPQPRFGDKLF